MTEYEPDPRRWKALAVSLTAGFMGLLDVSIVNVALPSMQTGLHATSGGVQWVVSGYALAFGLVLVTGGRLGDAFGRRHMFLIALAAFVLTSALAGAAPNETMLVIARACRRGGGGHAHPAEHRADPGPLPRRRTRPGVRDVRRRRRDLDRGRADPRRA